MNVPRERWVLVVILVLIISFGYWSGIGYYLQMSAFTMLPANFFFLVKQRNSTDINVTTVIINTTQAYTIQDENETTVSVTSANFKTDVYYSTTSLDILLNESSQINGSQMWYITSHNVRNGRLGNQMFRYASLLGIAKSQGRKLVITPGSELQDTFKLHYVEARKDSHRWSVIREEHAYALDKKFTNLPLQNLRIDGYLQSFKYFSSYVDEVRQEFIFQDSIANYADKILHDLLVNHKSELFVGVHVRRGDFLRSGALGFGVPEKSYFFKAFDLIKSKFPNRNLTFLVGSDDLDWCRKHLISTNVIVLPNASPAVHMAVISGCEHVIISGGSFGWWSAWLASGYVIYFKGFMEKGTKFGDLFSAENYYSRVWIGLGN